MTGPLGATVLWVTGLPFVRATIERTPPGRALAGRFVAGPSLEDGIRAAQGLHELGISTILDHLGENVTSAAQAAEAADAYVSAIERARSSAGLDVAIAVKLTQLGLDQDVDLCLSNMQRILSAAAEAEPATLVMIDMESAEYVDRTLHVYLRLRERYSALGVALQSCLRRTMADAERIAAPDAIVRVTKGAYLEPPEAAFQRRSEVAESFRQIARLLFESGAKVHVATHDERLVDGALDFLRRVGIDESRHEFQMLYGIRRDLQTRLVGRGARVRVYVPYGTQWYPYLTRRLAERPANMWFFASNLIRFRG